jgi:hypothetical protein
MKNYTIPDELISGFQYIGQLDQAGINKIIETIESIPIGLGIKGLNSALKKNLGQDSNESLADVIYSFGGLLSSIRSDEIEKVTDDLIFSLKLQLKEILPEENRLKNNLLQILSKGEKLKYRYKVISLLTDNDKSFLNSRIISDIRFVFKDDIKETDRRALIIHKLKFDFIKDGCTKNFYIALDSIDLVKLQEQISRALEKERALKNDYSNINFIEISE